MEKQKSGDVQPEMPEGKELDVFPEILTAQNIADYLHISRRRVYELMKLSPDHGGIPSIEIGITKRVRKETFETWLKRQERKMA
jgi:excisionase family DNA binding protein